MFSKLLLPLSKLLFNLILCVRGCIITKPVQTHGTDQWRVT